MEIIQYVHCFTNRVQETKISSNPRARFEKCSGPFGWGLLQTSPGQLQKGILLQN